MLTDTDAPDLTGTTIMHRAFQDCTSLGSAGSMNSWDVSSVTDMGAMFENTQSFDQPLGNWDVSSVTIMNSMFKCSLTIKGIAIIFIYHVFIYLAL